VLQDPTKGNGYAAFKLAAEERKGWMYSVRNLLYRIRVKTDIICNHFSGLHFSSKLWVLCSRFYSFSKTFAVHYVADNECARHCKQQLNRSN